MYQLIPMMLLLLTRHFEYSSTGLAFRARHKPHDEVSLTGLSCILGSHVVELTRTFESPNCEESWLALNRGVRF